ncbi:MAG: hypothetical protein HC869_27295, partial [Rhodospirillales bacterium]|nr:hypothetical protein [Rhodospirillales bacterium]
DEVSASGGANGSNQQKIGDYYNAYNDRDAIDAAVWRGADRPQHDRGDAHA